MNNFKITCRCGHYVTKNDDLYRLSYYKVQKPTLSKTQKNERIVAETFYCYVCPECNSDVVVIKRKIRNNSGRISALLPQKLIGLEAVKYLQMTENNRIDKTHSLEFSVGVFTKGEPMTYYKTLSPIHQRPRYINECGYSGKRIENEVKILEK